MRFKIKKTLNFVSLFSLLSMMSLYTAGASSADVGPFLFHPFFQLPAPFEMNTHSETETAADFNPNGIWSLRFTGTSFGLSAYQVGPDPNKGTEKTGDDFNTSDFFPERVQVLNAFTPLNITLTGNQLTVTGGPSSQSRNFRLRQSSSGLIRADSLSVQDREAVPGCAQSTGFGERIIFDPANPQGLIYGFADVDLYTPAANQPDACKGFLQQLGQSVSAGTAPPKFLALNATNSLDLNNIQNLVEADLFFLFEGQQTGVATPR
jgi:hypothetical protein